MLHRLCIAKMLIERLQKYAPQVQYALINDRDLRGQYPLHFLTLVF